MWNSISLSFYLLQKETIIFKDCFNDVIGIIYKLMIRNLFLYVTIDMMFY